MNKKKIIEKVTKDSIDIARTTFSKDVMNSNNEFAYIAVVYNALRAYDKISYSYERS